MRKTKGFTLIEILIVVVILGILASMILPRLLSQTERGVIAEAQQMLGAIRTAQTRTEDLGGGTGYQTITSCGVSACTASEWTTIGMTAPTTGMGNFNYACTAGTTVCTATRVGGGAAHAGNTIQLNQTGAWTCGGAGTTPYVATTPTSGGCQ